MKLFIIAGANIALFAAVSHGAPTCLQWEVIRTNVGERVKIEQGYEPFAATTTLSGAIIPYIYSRTCVSHMMPVAQGPSAPAAKQATAKAKRGLNHVMKQSLNK